MQLDLRPYICPDPKCQKSFKLKNHLKVHVERKHEGRILDTPSKHDDSSSIVSFNKESRFSSNKSESEE